MPTLLIKLAVGLQQKTCRDSVAAHGMCVQVITSQNELAFLVYSLSVKKASFTPATKKVWEFGSRTNM